MSSAMTHPAAEMDRVAPSFSHEKEMSEVIPTDVTIVSNWNRSEEVALRRKLDFIFLPMLMLGLFALQLDKGNISYAITTSFTKDLGIDNNDVNTGNQLMSAAIVIFEVPFNMVLSRIGPAKWLTIQMFSWGIIATAQTAIRDKAGFYASRFLLGMWEAGYLAASLTILASFYTRKEMALRVTLVYVGNYFSSGLGGLIAAAIFNIPESTGLKRWQWLFLIDGIFTLVVGVFFIFLMPGSSTNTAPICGLKKLDFFTDRDRQLLNNRVVLDDPRKTTNLTGIGFKKVLRIMFTNFRIWGHFGINVIALAPKGALTIYSPTIIKNLGFSSIKASSLSSVSYFGVCIAAIGMATLSDKLSMRGPLCLVCAAYSIIFAGVQFSVVHSKDVWLKYAILTLLNSGNAVSQSINDAWLSVNTADPQVRCIGIALAVAGSNLGGLAGQNIFVKSDAPYYPKGFMKILCIYAASIVLILVMIVYYLVENKRMSKAIEGQVVVTEEGAEIVDGDGSMVKVKNQI